MYGLALSVGGIGGLIGTLVALRLMDRLGLGRAFLAALVYELTSWGYQLQTVTTARSAWGAQSAQLPHDADMSPDTVVLAVRAHCRPLEAGAEALRVALRVADHRDSGRPAAGYVVTATDGAVSIGKTNDEPANTLTTDSRTLQRLIFRRTTAAAEVEAGRLTTTLSTAALGALVSACSISETDDDR